MDILTFGIVSFSLYMMMVVGVYHPIFGLPFREELVTGKQVRKKKECVISKLIVSGMPTHH